MKIAAITFYNEHDNFENRQTILGFFEDNKVDCPEVNNESCFKYQIRSDDDGKGEPATIESKVVVNHYGDFITDTKIDFPYKENDEGKGYAVISENIDEYSDKLFDNNSYSLMNELELFRKNQLSEYIVDTLKDSVIGQENVINNIDAVGNSIRLNFYGIPYTLEIFNNKEFD